MKRVWIIALVCVLVSVAGFAQAPSQPLTEEAVAAILGDSSLVPGSCATQSAGVLFAATTVDCYSAYPPGRARSCCICEQEGDCVHCCRCETGATLTACVLNVCG
jgi:hypothetical protein